MLRQVVRRFVDVRQFTVALAICCIATRSPASARLAELPPSGSHQTSATLSRMGEEMSESGVRQRIAFRPFTPPRRVLAIALLPPFHGADSRRNRGAGFLYADAANRRYILAQWPRNGGTIGHFAALPSNDTTCSDVRVFVRGMKPNGIVWTTPRGLIMTLQADGDNDARTLEIEWRKLIRRGACR